MFKGDLEAELKTLAKGYPVVTVIGPRQSGKTTLVRYAFPEKKYANLEFPDIRAMATDDPRGFLDQFPDGAILDEIQLEIKSSMTYHSEFIKQLLHYVSFTT